MSPASAALAGTAIVASRRLLRGMLRE
jgi:hypothetical protein